MEYAQMKYEKDCLEAAKTDPGFDKSNIKEIADYHGRSLEDVQREVEAIRKFRGLFKHASR